MNINRTRWRGAAVAVIGSVTVIASPISAFAADESSATVSAGSLTITNPAVGDFAVTLDGTAKSANSTFDDFSVTDATGSGAGWSVTVGASQFAEYADSAYVPDGKTLAVDSLSMAAPTVAANGTSSPEPTLPNGPYTIDGATVEVASAATDQGMGTYDFTQAATPLTLSVPANAYAKTYRSTVTVSVVSGP